MSEEFMGSPNWHHQYDLEAGICRCEDDDDENTEGGPFDIPNTETASSVRLRKWRRAALVLNSSRRFRYALNLKKKEEKQRILAKIKANVEGMRAALLFQYDVSQLPGAGSQVSVPAPIPVGDFCIGPKQLTSMLRDHDFAALENYGGAKGLAEKLKSNTEKGISGEDADLLQRKNIFGSNTYTRKKGNNFWGFVLDACRDTTLIILMLATAASLALGIKTQGIKEGWYDGGSHALAVIIIIVVTATSNYVQSLQFQSINGEKQNVHVEVTRGGRRVQLPIFEIVVGDVIPLKSGDQVPADGVLISGHSLSLIESSTTGGNKIATFLMSGCKVANGYGTMLVTGVGVNTEREKVMASEETPSQVHLNGVATFTSMVSLGVAFVVLVVLMIRYFTGSTINPNGSVQFRAGETKVSVAIYEAVKIFSIAVTIVVVSVPEGLPFAITFTLAYPMRKMMRDKALVRRLSACETMGSATTICIDKTGILTTNMMTVVEALACGKKIEPVNNRSSLPIDVTFLLIEAIAQNTTGNVFVHEGNGDIEVTGSPTEKAILQWGVDIGMNFEAIRSSSSIIHAFPFNSEKKCGGVAVKMADSEVHIHWKGEAKIVLASCTRYIDANGHLQPMDDHQVTFFEDLIKDMATRSLCCVAFAFRSCKTEDVPTTEDELEHWNLPENDLVLLAIVGLKVVRWDRSVYANIQKFIQFQLTVTVVAHIINLVSAISSGDVPLNAVQLLWVNLIMDTLGALALITEPPTDHLIKRPLVGRRLETESLELTAAPPHLTAVEAPRRCPFKSSPFTSLREPLITSIMWKNIFIQTLYQVVILLVLNSCGESILNLEHDMTDHANKVLNTLMFNVSVFCQIFNMFNARKPDEINVFKGVTKNPFFMGIIGLTVVLQVLIIMFLGKFTLSVRLNWQLWVVSIVIGVLSCPLVAIGKLVPEKPIIKFFTRKLHMQINLEGSSNGGQDIELQEN